MIKYSKGTIKDYDKIVELGETWWEDSLFYKLYGIEFKPSRAIFEELDKLGALFVILGKVDDRLISCYVGAKSPYPFNPSIMTVVEFVWCIHKDYRTFKNLMGLLKEIDRVMLEEHVNFYSLAVSEEERYDSLAKIMSREKFNKMETEYSKFRRSL